MALDDTQFFYKGFRREQIGNVWIKRFAVCIKKKPAFIIMHRKKSLKNAFKRENKVRRHISFLFPLTVEQDVVSRIQWYKGGSMTVAVKGRTSV